MKKSTIFILFLLMAAVAVTHAQATLSYQGVLKKNSTGAAVDDGKYSLTFQLYESLTGGTPLWSETQTNTDIIGGVYAVQLGSVTPLSIPFDQPYFLGVTVDGAAELTPRTQLTAAPYALSLLGETNQFPNDGNVGIGTTDPDEKLHVIGNLKVEGDLEVTGATPAPSYPSSLDSAAIGDAPFRIMIGHFSVWDGVIYGDFSIAYNSSNIAYDVTFDEPFAAPPMVVVNYGHRNFHGTVENITANGFSVSGYRSSPSNYDANGPYQFIAIGLR